MSEEYQRLLDSLQAEIVRLQRENENLLRIAEIDVANMETWKQLQEQRCIRCKEGKCR